MFFFKPKTPIKPAKCYTEIEQIREKSVFVSRIQVYFFYYIDFKLEKM
jgi:hypothetical protein